MAGCVRTVGRCRRNLSVCPLTKCSQEQSKEKSFHGDFGDGVRDLLAGELPTVLLVFTAGVAAGVVGLPAEVFPGADAAGLPAGVFPGVGAAGLADGAVRAEGFFW